jgi:hypothetical protein
MGLHWEITAQPEIRTCSVDLHRCLAAAANQQHSDAMAVSERTESSMFGGYLQWVVEMGERPEQDCTKAKELSQQGLVLRPAAYPPVL